MISPHTPPGTKIVCINANVHDIFAVLPPNTQVRCELNGLKQDGSYTVLRIEATPYTRSGFCVILVEIDRGKNNYNILNRGGYDIARFRYAELPRSILQCLDANPADVAKHKERSKVRAKVYEAMRRAGI